MTKACVLLIALLCLLVACGPSPQAIQAALEQTEAARPTATPIPPTSTTMPSDTPAPTATLTLEPTRAYCAMEEASEVREQLLPLMDEYLAIFESATKTTASTQYLPLLKDLESVQEDLDAVDFPPCMENADLYMTEAMALLHESFEAILDNNLALASQKLSRSSDFIGEAATEVEKVVDCLPNCQP